MPEPPFTDVSQLKFRCGGMKMTLSRCSSYKSNVDSVIKLQKADVDESSKRASYFILCGLACHEDMNSEKHKRNQPNRCVLYQVSP